jgi:hypothetical protein
MLECMDKNAFLKLDINERAQYTWDNGEFISDREYYNQKIVLYSVSGFFVEVGVLLESNEITFVDVQEDEKLLFKYVKDLKIGNITGKNNYDGSND